MVAQDSGRPPAEAFYTVTDPEQARLLSNPASFRFLEPFVARDLSVKAAAEEVGCKLDTMLYRVKVLLKAELLKVSRLEKRAGRPIKYYRSVHDAYFVPFEATPCAEVEERLTAHFRERQALVVPAMARMLRQVEREGRRVYRRLDDGEVWQESAGKAHSSFDLYDKESYGAYMANYRGPIAEMMDDTVMLTKREAKELLTDFYEVWRRFHEREQEEDAPRQPYFLQFTIVPLEPS